MDPFYVFTDSFRQWFQNIGILVMLILLYNFIPNHIFQGKKSLYAILVGLIFGFAAIMGILIPWSGTSHPVIGINGVLIPLAGLVGGILSAGIVTIILLLVRVTIEGGVGVTPDVIIAIIAAVTGSAVHAARTRGILRHSQFWDLLLLSSFFALITTIILGIMPPLGGIGRGPGPLKDIDTAVIIFFGVLLLGWIILSIDRRKEGEIELCHHQEHLEELVRERTADLKRNNALQQATLESTIDGIVVIDHTGIVRGYNKTAAHMLDIRSLEEMHEDHIDVLRLIEYNLDNPDDFARHVPTILPTEDHLFTTDLAFRSGRIYELFVTPYRLKDEIIGRVMNFRDITGKKHAEDLLKSMNQKLLLLSGITRHDILNQITALKIYLYLLRTSPEEDTAEFLDRMDRIVRMMQHQTESTGEYQETGIHEPVWQHPPTVFSQAVASFADRNFSWSSEEMAVEILADPLLERALYNLIDNSFRHGGHVSEITLTAAWDNTDLLLSYADNGGGVDPGEKEKIFEKGFGKHSGFGMFLIHEILTITGIKIRECGAYGMGARFEIRVPETAIRPLVHEKSEYSGQ